MPALLDNVRYYLPADVPPLNGQDLRAFSRPKIVRPVRTRAADRAIDRRRCERRDEAELAALLGDPV